MILRGTSQGELGPMERDDGNLAIAIILILGIRNMCNDDNNNNNHNNTRCNIRTHADDILSCYTKYIYIKV